MNNLTDSRPTDGGRDLNLDTLTLDSGMHGSFAEGACLLEAASYLAGEPWSDHPTCVSPVLGAYGRRLNDRLSDEDRQKLKPLIPRLLNTAGDGQDEARGYLAVDWSIRTATPRWLDAAGLTSNAEELRALRPVTDAETARAARSAVRAARGAARHARDAARRRLQDKIRAELEAKHPADADAVAVAVAVAVAAADADAAAVADADAAAAAVAVAVADAAAKFAYGSAGYWKVYDAVRARVLEDLKARVEESSIGALVAVTNAEAISLLERMIDPSQRAE